MTDPLGVGRRSFLRAFALHTARGVGSAIGLASDLRAAAVEGLLGTGQEGGGKPDPQITNEQLAAPDDLIAPVHRRSLAGEMEVRTESLDGSSRRYERCRSGADLAALLRSGRVWAGAYFGPLILEALSGTATETIGMSNQQRWTAMRATARLLARTVPESGTAANVTALVEGLWERTADEEAGVVAQAFRTAAEDWTSQITLEVEASARILAELLTLTDATSILALGLISREHGSPIEPGLGLAHARLVDPKVWLSPGESDAIGRSASVSAMSRAGISAEVVEGAGVGALFAANRVGAVLIGPSLISEEVVICSSGGYVASVLAAVHGVPCLVSAPASAVVSSVDAGALGTLLRARAGTRFDRVPRTLVSACLAS